MLQCFIFCLFSFYFFFFFFILPPKPIHFQDIFFNQLYIHFDFISDTKDKKEIKNDSVMAKKRLSFIQLYLLI